MAGAPHANASPASRAGRHRDILDLTAWNPTGFAPKCTGSSSPRSPSSSSFCWSLTFTGLAAGVPAREGCGRGWKRPHSGASMGTNTETDGSHTRFGATLIWLRKLSFRAMRTRLAWRHDCPIACRQKLEEADFGKGWHGRETSCYGYRGEVPQVLLPPRRVRSGRGRPEAPRRSFRCGLQCPGATREGIVEAAKEDYARLLEAHAWASSRLREEDARKSRA